MEVSPITLPLSFRPLKRVVVSANPKPDPYLLQRSSRVGHPVRGCRAPNRIHAIEGSTDLAPVEITWQIAIGALAGATPFVVAGIEFGKRIVAQRRCELCGGSGLVQRDDYSARCPGCGGFLPWQSWKRFFTG